MSPPIIVVEGRGSVLELHADRLVARRSGFMTFVVGKGNKEINLASITAVSIASEATAISGGLLQFSTGSGILGDYNFWFSKSNQRDVDEIKKYVEAKIAERRVQATPLAAPTPALGLADEIEKLAKLRDQGILTPAEFEAKKKSLLGL